MARLEKSLAASAIKPRDIARQHGGGSARVRGRHDGKANSMRCIIAGVLIILAGLPGMARADAIDDYVRGEMALRAIPGVAVAVLRHGRIERAQGYGIANIEHQVPVHPDTMFKSGAVGMQFTALAAMLLVEDGKLGLDESIARYLPQAPAAWKRVTIRQLLNHTSGLPATPAGEFRTDYSDDELLAILYKQDIGFTAGARWRFSYVDYVVLGFIIRKATGEYHGDLLNRRVFRPLGMTRARSIDEIAIVPDRAAGYERRDGALRNAEWVSPTANSTADGTLYLSLLDYAAWDAGLADHKLLSPTSWAEIARPAAIASGKTYPYGFGWYQQVQAGQAVWHHAGSWQGFRSAIVRYLGDGLTVVALANSDDADAEAIARHVAGLVEPKLALPPAAPIADTTPQRTQQALRLLDATARDAPDYAAFTGIAKLDITEMTAEYAGLVQPLGRLEAIAPFARATLGDDAVTVYRARYAKGVVEARVSIAPDGRIGDLRIAPVAGWDAPLIFP